MELPEVRHLEVVGSVVIVAVASPKALVCVQHRVWRFLFRGTKPAYGVPELDGIRVPAVWFDWEVVPAKNTYESAIHRLREMAAEQGIIRIGILDYWKQKIRTSVKQSGGSHGD